MDSRHIAKHRKDVFRPVAMLAPTGTYMAPDTLKKDVDDFCEVVKEELPNADFFKSAGVRGGTEEQSLKQLESTFMLLPVMAVYLNITIILVIITICVLYITICVNYGLNL